MGTLSLIIGRSKARPEGSVKLVRDALGVSFIEVALVGDNTARRVESAERRHALRPFAGAGFPEVGAYQRLRAMLKGLLDGHDDHGPRLLAVDRETPLQCGINADARAAVDTKGLARAWH